MPKGKKGAMQSIVLELLSSYGTISGTKAGSALTRHWYSRTVLRAWFLGEFEKKATLPGVGAAQQSQPDHRNRSKTHKGKA